MADFVENQRVLTPEQKKVRMDELNGIGLALSKNRSLAISERGTSGIEDEWNKSIEHYEGIDDRNRNEHLTSTDTQKPLFQAPARSAGATGSSVFYPVTRPFTDSATSRLTDMILPVNEGFWSFNPTPIPDMLSISEGKIPAAIQKQIEDSQPVKKITGEEEKADKIADITDQVIESERKISLEAKEKAKRAELRVKDWHVSGKFSPELKKVIAEATKLGTGILKGPIPSKSRSIAFLNGELKITESIVPISKSISPYNFFPDPGAGDNIHNGAYVFERDDITPKLLAKLIGVPGYLDDQIIKTLDEGPQEADKTFDTTTSRPMHGLHERVKSQLFEIWHYYGELKKEDLENLDCDFCGKDRDVYDALIIMVNNNVIKATLNPLEDGEFPYDLMVYQKRDNSPWGIGVPRQMREAQRVINGGIRNLMDNAGMAGGPMLVTSKQIEPADDVYEIAPRKMWEVAEGVDPSISLKDSIFYLKMDMMTDELIAIIELGLKMAEEATGVTMMLQGQQGNAPDTLGGMVLLEQNSTSILRMIVGLFDDRVTTPHLTRYYRYLMMHGTDDSEKGDFEINAKASTTLIDRDIRNQNVDKIFPLTQDPTYGISKKKWAIESLKANKLEPKNFQMDTEEETELSEQLAAAAQPQQTGDPTRVEVAEINKSAKLEVEMIKAEVKGIELEKKQDFEGLLAQAKQQNEELKLAVSQDQTTEKIEASLRETILKLETQIGLSGKENSPEVTTPPTEPAGRAPDGQAFEK